jgi:hypothetical protein
MKYPKHKYNTRSTKYKGKGNKSSSDPDENKSNTSPYPASNINYGPHYGPPRTQYNSDDSDNDSDGSNDSSDSSNVDYSKGPYPDTNKLIAPFNGAMDGVRKSTSEAEDAASALDQMKNRYIIPVVPLPPTLKYDPDRQEVANTLVNVLPNGNEPVFSILGKANEETRGLLNDMWNGMKSTYLLSLRLVTLQPTLQDKKMLNEKLDEIKQTFAKMIISLLSIVKTIAKLPLAWKFILFIVLYLNPYTKFIAEYVLSLLYWLAKQGIYLADEALKANGLDISNILIDFWEYIYDRMSESIPYITAVVARNLFSSPSFQTGIQTAVNNNAGLIQDVVADGVKSTLPSIENAVANVVSSPNMISTIQTAAAAGASTALIANNEEVRQMGIKIIKDVTKVTNLQLSDLTNTVDNQLQLQEGLLTQIEATYNQNSDIREQQFNVLLNEFQDVKNKLTHQRKSEIMFQLLGHLPGITNLATNTLEFVTGIPKQGNRILYNNNNVGPMFGGQTKKRKKKNKRSRQKSRNNSKTRSKRKQTKKSRKRRK